MTPTEDIKQRLDIADLIGEYISIKPAGAGSFKALCPFHNERSPSFHISRARQGWHCFGCGLGGDHFSFVMQIEGMEFPEALQLLAQKAGVTLPTQNLQQTSRRKRLLEVNDLAARFFRSVLLHAPQAEHARGYVQRRGVDELTGDLFRLGYAPDTWSSLSDALAAKGVTQDEMLACGLVSKREKGGGVYDRFRGRLMFPIMDVQGHVVGFTGRILTDAKDLAKYVNTPETVLYKKSAVLYGLDKAKGEVRRADQAVIVEGNMDVIASHQAGIANVVASSGTALTDEQLSLLERFTKKLSIAFDQDNAGQAATLRGLDIARARDMEIRIITLPPEAGKDPDEAVRKDPKLWKQAIADAITIMEWVYRSAFRGKNLSSPEDKKDISRAVLPEIARISDPVERDHWLKRLAQDLDVSVEALREAMGGKRASTRAPSNPQRTAQPVAEEQKSGLDEQVLGLMLQSFRLWQEGVSYLRPEYLLHDLSRGLYERLTKEYSQLSQDDAHVRRDMLPSPTSLTPEEESLYQRLAIRAEREYQDTPADTRSRELKTLLERLRETWKRHRVADIERLMKDAERINDRDAIANLARLASEILTSS